MALDWTLSMLNNENKIESYLVPLMLYLKSNAPCQSRGAAVPSSSLDKDKNM